MEPPRSRLLTIAGNVPGAVSLKLLPAADDGLDDRLRPLPTRRRIFARLKLRAPPLAPDCTPTMRALECREGCGPPPTQRPPASSSALLAAERMLIASSLFGGPAPTAPNASRGSPRSENMAPPP